MRHSAFTGLLFAVLIVLFPSLAGADAAADIEKLEQKRIQALLDVDMPVLDAIYADDFLYNLGSGAFLPKSKYLPMYTSGEVKVNTSESEGREVRVYGDTAVVTDILHVNATIKGEARICICAI